jgi:hypothetical protein
LRKKFVYRFRPFCAGIVCILATHTELFSQQIIWSNIYSDEYETRCAAIAPSYDGGIVLCGDSKVNQQDSQDILVLKVDSLGSPIWSRILDLGNDEIPHDICLAHGHSYVIAGSKVSASNNLSTGFLTKIDSIGNILWTRYYGSTGFTGLVTIENYLHDGFITVGSTVSADSGNDAYLVRLDSLGEMIWTSALGKMVDRTGIDVAVSENGTIYALGSTNPSSGGQRKLALFGLDSAGNNLFSKNYGDSSLIGSVINIAPDNRILIAGEKWVDYVAQSSTFLLKVSSDGDSILMNSYDMHFGHFPKHDLKSLADGGHLICGTRGEWLWIESFVMKVDHYGTLKWFKTYQHSGHSTFGIGIDARQLNYDSSFYMAGYVNYDYTGGGTGDLMLLKIRDSSFHPLSCGNCNGDVSLDLRDVIYLIDFIFKGGLPPIPMLEAGDVDDSGRIDILDVTYLITFLYKGGPAPNCG